MNNYLLLGACFLLGILLRRLGRLPDNAAASLNGFVVHISLPALTLAYVHGLQLQTTLILPALMAWVLFAIGCGFFWLAGKALGFSRATTGALTLTGGLANTSFVGLPMIETFYGQQYLGLGILIDQLGSYFVLSTLGIAVASFYSSGHSVSAKAVMRKIALFVPFQAFVLALLLMPFDIPGLARGTAQAPGLDAGADRTGLGRLSASTRATSAARLLRSVSDLFSSSCSLRR